jgi:hypothetical protein
MRRLRLPLLTLPGALALGSRVAAGLFAGSALVVFALP